MHSIIFFRMLLKPNPSCYLCRHDRVLRSLKTKVTEIQVELKVDWRSTPVIQIENHLLSDNDVRVNRNNWFLMNTRERPMVIPSYGLYDETWKKAMFLNPLEVDWSLFEIHGSNDVDYVTSLIEVLEDQRDLWNNDEDTNDQPIMVMFIRFIGAIKRLLLYSLSVANLVV